MSTPAQLAKLALEDGTVFTGNAVGAAGTRTGEVVFNTAMTGYQEVFTDPSYCGQIVTMTFPLQGNYGVNVEDFESRQTHLSGVVLREVPRRPSNFRASGSLRDFLQQRGIIGLARVDTRALTRRIRVTGAMRGVISTEIGDDLELIHLARAAPPMSGANLVEQVAPREVATWEDDGSHVPATAASMSYASPASATVKLSPPATDRPATTGQRAASAPSAACHIVAVDCGIKHNILRLLAASGARVTVVPAGTDASRILQLAPDGLLIGNGPGDPAAVTGTVDVLRSLLGKLPMLGICLGHQLLALALGARTYKLKFGHHGANLPVLNRGSGRIEITSQNHGFAVDMASLERVGGTVTHVNLNDDSLEGFLHQEQRVLAVQFHPEASPGPHDAAYVIQRFAQAVQNHRPLTLPLLAP